MKIEMELEKEKERRESCGVDEDEDERESTLNGTTPWGWGGRVAEAASLGPFKYGTRIEGGRLGDWNWNWNWKGGPEVCFGARVEMQTRP